jgi:hypothetical protein
MADSILDFFSSRELRAVVVKTLADICSIAKTIQDGPQEDMQRLSGESLWDEAWRRAQTSKSSDISKAFEKHAFSRMPTPQRITPEETMNAFWAAAKPVQSCSVNDPSNYAESVYSVFLNYVAHDVLRSGGLSPLTVARVYDRDRFSLAECPEGIIGMELVTFGDDPDDIEDLKRLHEVSSAALDARMEAERRLETENLWDADGVGVSVPTAELSGEVQTSPCADLDNGWSEELSFLHTHVTGRISQEARSILTNELTRVLPSVIRSVAVVQKTPTWASEEAFLIESKCRLPIISLAVLVKNIHFLRHCLDTYFRRPCKKDSMDRRIRNAVSLLVESDTQTNDAVGFALSVAAIEALLGEKVEGLTERLSGNLAVLLEPDLGMRMRATAFFKKLYDRRSAALHGRELDDMSEHRHNGRRVAAGVLYGVVNRQGFLRRLGDDGPETPEELLRDLRNCHWSAGPPMGIPELPITELWRESGP